MRDARLLGWLGLVPFLNGCDSTSQAGQSHTASPPPVLGKNGARPTVSYSTDFGLTEAAIAEGGKWNHKGLDWTVVATANGIAYGTQDGAGHFDDSYAYLSGFPPNQRASGVIHAVPGIRGCCQEAEILLRWSDAEHNARGYECNVAFDGSYSEIVRWNGKLGDFKPLARGAAPGGIREGDVLSAEIVGSTITVRVNGTVTVTATDSTFKDGNPGIGLFLNDQGGKKTAKDFAFKHFEAAGY